VADPILIAAIVSGYVRPIRRRGSDQRDHDPIRVMLLIKESANRVPCRRLFFHLSAQIDGSVQIAGSAADRRSESDPLQKVSAAVVMACNLLTER
jgi:hypothetical protein